MTSVNLKFSNSIHDNFLHVSPSFYNKIFTQKSPLIQLILKESYQFWCVKDHSIGDNCVVLNRRFAESLKLVNDTAYKVSLPIANCVNLTKVIVSLPFEAEDWIFLHENFELIQSTILDQIRLIKRGDRIPIYTSIRKYPLWLLIEEFGGYQSPDILGIISNDTELVVIEVSDSLVKHKTGEESVYLIAVPSSQFHISCNPIHNLKRVCSFKKHSFTILADDKVPRDCMLIPNVIMNDIFKINPKDRVLLTISNDENDVPFTSFIHYTVDGSKPEFTAIEHSNESIISASNGFSIKSSNSYEDEIVKIKHLNFDNLNEYAKLMLETSHRLILFHGQSGCGKTEYVIDAINQLNFCPDYTSKIIYVDLLASELDSNCDFNSSTSFILDHVDEFLVDEPDSDEKMNKKYAKLWKKLEWIIQMNTENRVTIISRSSKIFSKLSTKISLPFDYIFTLENENNWKFQMNRNPFESVFGLKEAKSLLELHILHPLQFSDVYKFNQMNLHSSVLIYGPSGSGKTFLAKKFIEHYNIPCIFVRGPEILDKYVGASERGVRDLFSRARNIKPCMIVFDEIDSLVPSRGSNQAGVTDRIVNQFLTELDGTEDRSGIFMIGTTSRPDLIDKAILRPGRIDQRIELRHPSAEDVKKFIFSKGLKLNTIKPLINFLEQNANVEISWADLAAVDWNDSASPISVLIQSLSIKKQTCSEDKSFIKATDQKLKLSLA